MSLNLTFFELKAMINNRFIRSFNIVRYDDKVGYRDYILFWGNGKLNEGISEKKQLPRQIKEHSVYNGRLVFGYWLKYMCC